MESIFCSSGITASGVAGIEPDDQPFGGFTIAKLLYTANEEPVRAPSLGFGTAHTKKAGGDKKATELFLLLRIIHPPDLPDRPACQGVWFLEPHQILDYFKVVTAAFRQAVKKLVERAPRSYVLVTFWQDIIPGACFEPSTSLTSCPSGPILEQSDDVDAGYISGYIRNDGGIITFHSVAFDLTVEDLVDKLPDDLANWILEMDPAPASGLVPLQASTGIIEHGVIRRNHQNIRFGWHPGEGGFGVAFKRADGSTGRGIPDPNQDSPCGMDTVHILLTPEEVRSEFGDVDDAWLALGGEQSLGRALRRPPHPMLLTSHPTPHTADLALRCAWQVRSSCWPTAVRSSWPSTPT